MGVGKVQPQLDKVDAILNYLPPTRKKDMRAFLGRASYYRCFITNFSALAAHLFDLTSREVKEPLPWKLDHQEAFKELKCQLTREPVLLTLDFTKKFVLFIDPSD